MISRLKPLFESFFIFIRKDFHLAAYIYAISVTGLCILLIYCTEIGQEIGESRFPCENPMLNNMLMFVLLYFLIAVPVLMIKKQFHRMHKLTFFTKGLLLMLLIGFADAFSWRDVLGIDTLSSSEQSYIFKSLWRMRNVMFVLPVLILLRIFIDKKIKSLYGLCRGNHLIQAYLCLYVIILPVLAVVSFTPDFLSYYPMYKPWIYENVFNRSALLNTLIFETVYAVDFLMVELIFRGVLVIGMAEIVGRSAVLPMVAVYVGLHFGKPVMETCSAMFGGYFLGALAFQTRHIWGGVVIHIGIALIIEFLRFFQHYLLEIG